VVGESIAADWTGRLVIPKPDFYRFQVDANVDASLDVAGVTIARTVSGIDRDAPPAITAGELYLKSGTRPRQLRVFDARHDFKVEMRWAPRGGPFTAIPASALRSAAGLPGLDASYRGRIPGVSGLGKANARQALRDLSIRYVVTADEDNVCVSREL